jgi:hypothetical protein
VSRIVKNQIESATVAAPKLIGKAEVLARVGNPAPSTLWEWMA